jgi:hypothetical protein
MGTLVSWMLLRTRDLGVDELLAAEVRMKMGVFVTVASMMASAPTAPEPVLRSKPTWCVGYYVARQRRSAGEMYGDERHLAVVDVDILERPTWKTGLSHG